MRSGDVVEVKSAAEILATLDDTASKDALPFMPEMLRFAGQRFVVDKRADKICDTIHFNDSRRLPNAVLLGDLRCDGSAHDGCQAECRIFWKEEWLRPVEARTAAPPSDASGDATSRLADLAARSSRTEILKEGRSEARYRCQATEAYVASRHLKLTDPRPYLRELWNGNVRLGRFLRIMVRLTIAEVMRKRGRRPDLALVGTAKPGGPKEPSLDLQPGDRVRVRDREEIATTLNAKGRNRGLWFDREMLPYCGETLRVRQRVRQFIEEETGEMVRLQSDCVTLEGAVCQGEHSSRRWFCPRAIYPFWRDAWLEREPRAAVAGSTHGAPETPQP